LTADFIFQNYNATNTSSDGAPPQTLQKEFAALSMPVAKF